LLRSGTSIGANIEEAIGAQTKRDFIAKISIGYKEARETLYWLKLLAGSGYLDEKSTEDLISRISELIRILSSIQKTSIEKEKIKTTSTTKFRILEE
jgi:four helix bundle protein